MPHDPSAARAATAPTRHAGSVPLPFPPHLVGETGDVERGAAGNLAQPFEGSATRQRFRAHDLRATFVTIALATGKSQTWVSDRTGHDGHSMIERYRRKARTWTLGQLGHLTCTP